MNATYQIEYCGKRRPFVFFCVVFDVHPLESSGGMGVDSWCSLRCTSLSSPPSRGEQDLVLSSLRLSKEDRSVPPELLSSFLPTFQCLFRDFLTQPHTLFTLVSVLPSSLDSVFTDPFPHLLVRFSLASYTFPSILSDLLRIHITSLHPFEPQLLFR